MKSYLDELHLPSYLQNPIESALKAIGLDLLQVLSPALEMRDLRYIPGGNADLPGGIVILARYMKEFTVGYVITSHDEMNFETMEDIAKYLIKIARKEKKRSLHRIILLS